MQSIFHLALHVRDLESSRQFYGDLLGGEEGRSTDTWVDFNFFGHQLSLHLGEPFPVSRTGKVGEHRVPMPHFGVILNMSDWIVLKDRLINAEVKFVLSPNIRFPAEPGEQATMFFMDPAGNPIEIKGFTDFESVYAA
ncbi:VOC family protein [Pseudomonas sp. MDT1-16]|uniref:VOC family protein n=1 Tax=Pseudomonas sp. AL03 TaxID=3042230 RepID=UPI00249CB2D3|nr:VOC family protein [Pseudomonas sp. AL03]MDI3275483.1 VOC family protein [Pseudomonas sp. AL03]